MNLKISFFFKFTLGISNREIILSIQDQKKKKKKKKKEEKEKKGKEKKLLPGIIVCRKFWINNTSKNMSIGILM